jgi:hypothetical protein
MQGPLLPTDHRAKMGELMRRFSAAGVSLKVLSGPLYMGRKIGTLRRYARDFDLKFPDYVPLALREKKPAKQKSTPARRRRAREAQD